MSIYSRYTFLFLSSVLLLSYDRETVVLVNDVSSIRYRGDRAELHLSAGVGEWKMEGPNGISLIFSRGDGTIISYCPFGCEIWGSVSPEQHIQVVLQHGDIELNDIPSADIFLSDGSIDGSGIGEVDMHIGRGRFDLSLCTGSQLSVQGYEIDGKLFLCSGIWNQSFVNGVMERQVTMQEDAIGSYKIQIAAGTLDVLSDSVAEVSK